MNTAEKNSIIITKSPLLEVTRTQLAASSRNAGAYKDQSKGKNRFARKRYSKIAATVKQYNSIDMNALFKEDRLEVQVPVIGETDTYKVTIRINGVIAELAKSIKLNNYKLEFKNVIQSLTKMFNTTDVYINCTCPDHLYNFAHWNIVHNCSTEDSAHDPGPGKNKANPQDDKGRGCKHALLVLANGDWMMKVASVINNYVHYMSEKKQKLFLKLIFPKLYGCTSDEMTSLNILGEEEKEATLDSSSSFIDAINDYGRSRGKFKPGSNKNTATKISGTTKQNSQQPELKQAEKQETIKQEVDPNKNNLKKAEQEVKNANKQVQKEISYLDK